MITSEKVSVTRKGSPITVTIPHLSPVLVTVGKSEFGYSFRGFGAPFSSAPYVKRPDLLPGLSLFYQALMGTTHLGPSFFESLTKKAALR